jgi:Glu-tRNA(Gln) amidotransferase subunit E-like FAD-binding protein
MTQVHFTLKSEEIQSIIEYSVKDDVSKNILTTVFNQLMENQRTEYIQAKEYQDIVEEYYPIETIVYGIKNIKQEFIENGRKEIYKRTYKD